MTSQTIMTYSTDINEAEQPDPLPYGVYPASVVSAEIKESNTTGNKYYMTSFRILPDAYPADFNADNAPDGVTLAFRRTSAEDTPVGRFQVRQHCEALGAPMSTSIDCAEWIGLNANVEIVHEEYEGVMRATIKKVLAA
jgi:hypothetical protein